MKGLSRKTVSKTLRALAFPLRRRRLSRHNVRMLIYCNPEHAGHAPTYEFFRGDKVSCFETPARADHVLTAMQSAGHPLRVPDQDASTALAQVHSARYLDFLRSAWTQWLALDASNAQKQPFPSVWPIRDLRADVEPDNFVARLGLYSMDTGSPLSAGTWAAAHAGAAAAASAAHAVGTGAPAAFCLTRPPGHHAGADFMGGYCFINNAAVAAQTLRNLGVETVAVVDVDFHHGNGTQSIFYQRADVFFASIHGDPRTEYPFYLGHADETGAGPGAGFNLNLPLPAGAHTAEWFAALEQACCRVQDVGAGALVVSLGLDTYADDPICSFSLQQADFERLGARLAQCGLRTVFVLEGGYATEALGHNAQQVIAGFEGAAA